MAIIDIHKLQLKVTRTTQYDPHLREEILRAETGLPGTRGITREEEGRRVVDVIARLKQPGDRVEGLQSCRPIADRFVTATLPVGEIERVRPLVESLKAAKETYPRLYHSVPAIQSDPENLDLGARRDQASFPGLDGSGVLVGVVDFGCDFRHRNFRHATGATRILALWDQSAASGLPPKGFDYGREIRAEEINEALRADEDGAYEALGYTPAIAAHGTHVLDIAAGNGREPYSFCGRESGAPGQTSPPGVAPNAQILFVHLKGFEGGSLGNSRHLLEAVSYIFHKADELNMPAVVNVSLGSSGGPHDGTTPVEQAFEALVTEQPGRAIVVAAGNSFLQKGHLSGTVRAGEPRTILWNTDPLQADLETARNEMEVWYPGGKELSVRLFAPGAAEPLSTVPLGESADLYEGERRVGRLTHRERDPNNGDNQIDIRLPHVENVSGPWRIELSIAQGETGFHAWIEQDDRGLGSFEGEADSRYTLGEISCSPATLTVGAFDTAEKACLMRPYEATSSGPTRSEVLKPELSAPGVSIVAARAQGGVTLMSGTSMAAAHVTGVVALLFQLGQRAGRGMLPFAKVREILLASVDPVDPRHALRLGHGRINGRSAAAELLREPVRPYGLLMEPLDERFSITLELLG
ncbi:MAG: S8 family peptidase [Thermoanaerobaculia bacterium]